MKGKWSRLQQYFRTFGFGCLGFFVVFFSLSFTSFNTSAIIIAMGTAISDIAEMGLREIESTVKEIEKKSK